MEIELELNNLKKSHIPSYSRKLIKLAKTILLDKDKLDLILERAQDLEDPYYNIFTLVNIASELERAGYLGFEELYSEAVANLENVTPEWRKVEISEICIKKMRQINLENLEEIILIYNSIQNPKLRTKLARTLMREIIHLGLDNYHEIIELAKTEDNKIELIKITANEMQRLNPSKMPELEEHIFGINNPGLQAKVYAYLGFKINKYDGTLAKNYTNLALSNAIKIQNENERLEIIKYIADSVLPNIHIFLPLLLKCTSEFDIQLNRVKLMGHIGGRIIETDEKMGKELFDEALKLLEKIDDSTSKARVMLNLAIGLKKANAKNADEIFNEVSKIAKNLTADEKSSIEFLITKAKKILEESKKTKQKETIIKKEDEDTTLGPCNSYIILGLYNTYDKHLASVHIRAVARAAPLCWAYNLNLGIFNFPFENIQSMLEKVRTDTSVGDGGEYLIKLFNENRILMDVDLSSPLVGTLIATTPKPDDDKKITVDFIPELIGSKCFLLGVGKLGLPKNLLEKSKHHLEFTGKNVSLETCTAMGILAHVLGTQCIIEE